MRSITPVRSVAVAALVLILAAVFIVACSARKGDEDVFLFKIGDEGVSVASFRHALELEQPNALSEQAEGDVETVLTFLNQMIEERLILTRAKELGIVIDDETLEAAVDDVRADYPDDTFEETLLENAVSFNQWREQLRRRLLLQKVVKQELEDKVEISPEDVATYYAQHYANREKAATGSGEGAAAGAGAGAGAGAAADAAAGAGDEPPMATEKPMAAESINAAIINHLRRSKAQAQYPAWIHSLQTRYGVTVDWDRWRELTEKLHPAATPQAPEEGMRLVSPPETP